MERKHGGDNIADATSKLCAQCQLNAFVKRSSTGRHTMALQVRHEKARFSQGNANIASVHETR
jgi:hypothetical protein